MPTANYSFPFPTLGDTPNVPRDVQALADAVDAELAAQAETGVRIMHGVGQTDASGDLVLSFAADVWAAQPTVIATPIEITGSQVRVRGGGSATSVTIRADNNAGNPVASCYVFWLAIGARGTAAHPG